MFPLLHSIGIFFFDSSSLWHNFSFMWHVCYLCHKPQTQLQKRKGELHWKSLCLSRNINNVGPQKAFNVVTIWLSSHGSFEKVTQIHNNGIFFHSSSLWHFCYSFHKPETHVQEKNGELQDWESSCLSWNISNVGSQKALIVVAVLLLPSHGSFEKAKSKSMTNQNLLQLSCKPQKKKHPSWIFKKQTRNWRLWGLKKKPTFFLILCWKS